MRRRRSFTAGPMTFGVVICHEGFRYPETVRWAARRGAQVVFHPHAHVAEPGSHRPTSFAEPANSFHEKAMLCRAAENTCYFASVNFASEGSGTTSAIVRPDGTLQCFQPYGLEGLLVADLDLGAASGRLASSSPRSRRSSSRSSRCSSKASPRSSYADFSHSRRSRSTPRCGSSTTTRGRSSRKADRRCSRGTWRFSARALSPYRAT